MTDKKQKKVGNLADIILDTGMTMAGIGMTFSDNKLAEAIGYVLTTGGTYYALKDVYDIFKDRLTSKRVIGE